MSLPRSLTPPPLPTTTTSTTVSTHRLANNDDLRSARVGSGQRKGFRQSFPLPLRPDSANPRFIWRFTGLIDRTVAITPMIPAPLDRFRDVDFYTGTQSFCSLCGHFYSRGVKTSRSIRALVSAVVYSRGSGNRVGESFIIGMWLITLRSKGNELRRLEAVSCT